MLCSVQCIECFENAALNLAVIVMIRWDLNMGSHKYGEHSFLPDIFKTVPMSQELYSLLINFDKP